jgi:hypothetical protein
MFSFRRTMKKLLLSLLAIFLIIEEWLWDLLTAFGHSLVRWLNLESFEQWLSETSPSMALVAFSIPILIVDCYTDQYRGIGLAGEWFYSARHPDGSTG